MSYKVIKVWDGSTWQDVGAQVPSYTLTDVGSETLSSGATTKAVTFTSTEFTSAPKIFLQVTGTVDANLRVTSPSTTGFTAAVTSAPGSNVTFNWMAVQKI
jgi:hypothetical protein